MKIGWPSLLQRSENLIFQSIYTKRDARQIQLDFTADENEAFD